MRDDLAILILAAGQSARMRGGDKLLEEVDGLPLIRRQALEALKVTADVIVALPPLPHARADALKGLAVQARHFAGSAEGMSGTLRDAVDGLTGRAGVLLVLGDMPEITAQDMARVITARRDNPGKLIWRGATQDGRPGHPILFDAACFPLFADLSGDGGARAVVQAAGDRVLLVPLPGQRARTDLDTPEDWAAWRAARG